jgi:hypothetical protein
MPPVEYRVETPVRRLEPAVVDRWQRSRELRPATTPESRNSLGLSASDAAVRRAKAPLSLESYRVGLRVLGLDVARVRRRSRLEQQYLRLFVRERSMLDATRDHHEFPRTQLYRRLVAELDP